MIVPAPARSFVTHVVARELVARAAQVLGAAGVPLMPLKGVWLQALVYDPPEDRALTDVDVLVPEARFAETLGLLEAAGFTRAQSNASEVALLHSDLPLQLDVHRRLFLPGAFALPTHELFARARKDDSMFDAEVWALDPIDGLSHLVGHFVKSRASVSGSPYHMDFARLIDGLNLDPDRCASRLERAGMGRAARYAFAYNVRSGHAGVTRIVEALRPDLAGALLCRASMALAARAHSGDLLGALPGYLLDSSLSAGVRVATAQVLERAQRRS